MRRLLILVAAVALLAGCKKEETPSPDPTEQTLLMYLPWSGNLTSFLMTNIEDMKQVIGSDVEISEFISKLNDYNGYQISRDKVPLGSKTSIILHTPVSTLTIFLSSSSISINDTHYRTITNYLEELN